MKLRVILSLIVVLFIGQSMCAMSTQILRRPIVLDGEIIEEDGLLWRGWCHEIW